MELKLSCYCCGCTDFLNKEIFSYELENELFVSMDNKKIRENAKVVCRRCNLEDYVVNLVPKAVI